ncbi:hypothetical protein KXX06_006283, partial [Aspergillus fumigatus]
MSQEHPFVEDDRKIQPRVAGLQNWAENERFVESAPSERSQKSSNHSPLPPVTRPRTLQRRSDMMSLNSILDESTDSHLLCSIQRRSPSRGSFLHNSDGHLYPENNEVPLSSVKAAEHKENDRTYHGFHRG